MENGQQTKHQKLTTMTKINEMKQTCFGSFCTKDHIWMTLLLSLPACHTCNREHKRQFTHRFYFSLLSFITFLNALLCFVFMFAFFFWCWTPNSFRDDVKFVFFCRRWQIDRHFVWSQYWLNCLHPNGNTFLDGFKNSQVRRFVTTSSQMK